MSIPSAIVNQLSFLQSQVTANQPLASASRATMAAIKLNAAKLVADIETALIAKGALDGWDAPADPISIVAGFNAIVVEADDRSNLCLMRGVTGRAVSNLNQIAS